MRLLRATCLLLMVVPVLLGANKPFTTGTIVDVQQKSTTRVLYYQVDTPITQNDPYYEISVQIKDTVYFGRYTPMHSRDTLPEDWHVGSGVEVRVEGRHLVLKRPGGTEMSFAFTRRPVVKAAPGGSAPSQ
jgi:hypothetical protein